MLESKFNYTKLMILFFMGSMASLNPIFGQPCIDNPNFISSSFGISSQSFTIPAAGCQSIENFVFYWTPFTGTSGNLQIFSGNSTAGTLLYSQPYTGVTADGPHLITLDTSFPVTANTQYTVKLDGAGQIGTAGGNPYPGGQSVLPDIDLYFIINFEDTDGDTVQDYVDNCPNTANADQADTNGNGVGDVCESAVACSANNGTCTISISN